MKVNESVFEESLGAVQRWVEQRDYKGYDPGDGLTSFLRPLTFGTQFGERVLQQAVWKLPINIRPMVGVKPMVSTKGRGFMAWGYMLRFKATQQAEYRDKAFDCLDWLLANGSPRYKDLCWGNHFDFTTRGGCIPAQEATIVWSGLIGQAFLEAFEQTNEARYLDAADRICQWVLKLPAEKTSAGTCISYVAFKQLSIHNSSLLGGALLGRTWKHVRRQEYLDLASESIKYSCERMLPGGAWWYGEAPMHHWIDNFHTGYNLDSIKRYIDATGDETYLKHLKKGYEYFKGMFFETDGRPRYYHNKLYPIDIQCASQAIDTFSFFSQEDPGALNWAKLVAQWTINNMQDRSGYFYYRKLPMITIRTPYFHWGQGTMFKALSHLLLKLEAVKKPALV